MDAYTTEPRLEAFHPGETEEGYREKPDGLEEPAAEAGWFLQRERERRGETLEQAGEATGIHPYHIEAIEFGDMTRMPERHDALEMIGIYAQYLGFDPEPLLQHYAWFLPRPQAAQRINHPAAPEPLSSAKILSFGKLRRIPRPSFRLPRVPGGAGGIVASAAGVLILFAGISWLMTPAPDPQQDIASSRTESSADPMPTATTGPDAAKVTVTEERLADDVASADAETVPDAGEQPSGDSASLEGLGALIERTIQEAPEQAPPAIVAEPEAQPVGKEIASEIPIIAEAAPSEAGRVFGEEDGTARLMLKAKGPVWVRVEDSQGNVVMTQMLMKGDVYRVPNREGLVVIARDGGLLSYLIDGQEKGILGTPGEILVGQPLDIDKLATGG